MHVTLMGKRYRIERGKYGRKRIWGSCDPPDQKDKAIRVDERTVDQHELEVFIHEMTHACDWRSDEHHVRQQSADIARALWRLGYRRVAKSKLDK